MISKLPDIETSIFSKMSAMANATGALNLSQGFPDFESDPKLITLVNAAMENGNNQYAPMPGDAHLRKIIAKKTENAYGKQYNWETEITITAGATQAIFTAIAAMINPGDEVLIFTPAYDSYEPGIRLFGGVPVPVQLRPPSFQVDWDEVASRIGPKTKMIMINSPHNPTGSLLTHEDMIALQELVVKHGLWVISDEVYEHIIFDNHPHESAAKYSGLAHRSFITASFGKTFHNTGWKMGYCLAPKNLMSEFRKVHQFNVFSVNHPAQKGLAAYMEDANTYLALPGFYEEKRDYFLKGIKDSRFNFIPSSGTYFQMLDYSEITSEHDVAYAERLTKEHGLATIPTSVFNKDKEDFKLLRVCFAKKKETLDKAISILNSI